MSVARICLRDVHLAEPDESEFASIGQLLEREMPHGGPAGMAR